MRNKQKKRKIADSFIIGGLTIFISILIIYSVARAGSLEPSGAPGSTMHTLEQIWNRIAGSDDTSDAAADGSGDVIERLEFIQQNLGGYTYGSSDAEDVLTVAGGTYNATNLVASNVRSGVTFATSSTGTYGGGGWTYGSDEAPEVLTIADSAGTYNASNLSVGTVKSGTAFGVGLTGSYPSATYTLPNADGTTDLASSGGNISSSNGAVEWWQSDGTRQTATLDFPTISNVCSTDTSNNSAGTLAFNAAYVVVGNTYCGTAGTLLANLFNGTGQGFTGGTQADGGVDDYNAGGTAASSRYERGWTACNSGNSYCGTGLASADAKDDSTNIIWSLPCNGSGCASFSDSAPITFTWDNSGGNNNSQTAAELCSAGSHGQSGWSLPHQKQLLQAYVDGSYVNLVSSSQNSKYWSNTTVSWATTNAWFVYLTSGWTDIGGKTGANQVRCVRSAS